MKLFGGVRKGKRGRGAVGKIVFLGLLKRSGKVYTAIIPDARTETLMPIIEEQVEPDSIVYTDTFKAYNALDVSCFIITESIITGCLQNEGIISTG